MQGFRNKNDIPQGGIHYGQIVPAFVCSQFELNEQIKLAKYPGWRCTVLDICDF